MYLKSDPCKDGKDIDEVKEYDDKALKWNDSDAKLKEFHAEITQKHKLEEEVAQNLWQCANFH